MAINFPSTPSNGDEYTAAGRTWRYNGTGWIQKSGPTRAFTFAATAPANPQQGDEWMDSDTGVVYKWIVDEDSGQWVRPVAGIDGTQGEQGLQGTVILHDGSEPHDYLPANNGDLYLNQDTGQWYELQSNLWVPLLNNLPAQRARIYAAPFDALAFNGLQCNGDHIISQANVNGAVTGIGGGSNTYITDQWRVGPIGAVVVTGQRSQTTPPDGFANFLRVTVTTVDSSIAAGDLLRLEHSIEGYRIAKLAFGTASAQPVSIGFWVRASITGTFGMALVNSASNRSYVNTFTINAANTWEFKTFTVPGDVTGTWQATTSIGLTLRVTLSAGTDFQGTAGSWQAANIVTTSAQTNFSGTNGATFDITGLIVLPGIELPTQAQLPLLMRSFDEELKIASRYYWKTYPIDVVPGTSVGNDASGTIQARLNGVTATNHAFRFYVPFGVRMRSAPTCTGYSVLGTINKITDRAAAADANINNIIAGDISAVMDVTTSSTADAFMEGHLIADKRF